MHKFDKTIETIKNFVKLFIIDQGAIDTISKDEWSRKINIALQKQNILDRKAKGEKIKVNEELEKPDGNEGNKYSLRRLDSFHLNQLTSKAFDGRNKKRLQGLNSGISPLQPPNSLIISPNSPSKAAAENSESSSPTPIRQFGKLKLEAIDETDSFCTDSSYVNSALCSANLLQSAKLKNVDSALTRKSPFISALPGGEDISEEDEDADEPVQRKPRLDV